MKRILLAIFLLSGAAQADEAAIQGVIDGQIDAFRQDDFAQAFTFAAPGIQGLFGTPERFGQMVRDGYPMVWRPGRVDYLDTDRVGKRWVQKVQIIDAAGRSHLLAYDMVNTANGWKIAGVRLLESADIGV